MDKNYTSPLTYKEREGGGGVLADKKIYMSTEYKVEI